MTRYIEGLDRRQTFLLPECVDDYVDEDNPVRVVEAFVDGLDLVELGFERAVPAETGRPSYHPATLLKLYIYGYLNRIPSSRRLGARGAAKPRVDVAARPSCTRFQDGRRLPPR